jgi:hypothetical protein
MQCVNLLFSPRDRALMMSFEWEVGKPFFCCCLLISVFGAVFFVEGNERMQIRGAKRKN